MLITYSGEKGIVCGVVLFELLYIGNMPDSEWGNLYDKKFLYGLAVSLFFLLEILIRFCNWRASYCAASRSVVGGFL